MKHIEDPALMFEQALLSLDRLKARRIFTQSDSHGTPMQSVETLVVPALENIGLRWEQGEIALSQVYMSGRICEELLDSILPSSNPSRRKQPKMAIAVLDDFHVLGKRIVYSMLRASGFDVIDFGHGVSVEELVKRVREERIEVLLISVLMLASALRIKNVKEVLNSGDHDVKIIVGGAPFRFDHLLWVEIGADAMGITASDAVEIITDVTKEN